MSDKLGYVLYGFDFYIIYVRYRQLNLLVRLSETVLTPGFAGNDNLKVMSYSGFYIERVANSDGQLLSLTISESDTE